MLDQIMSEYNTIQEGVNDTLEYLKNRISDNLYNIVSIHLEQFSDQVESTLDKIDENPELGPEYRRDIRNYLSDLDQNIVSIDVGNVSISELYIVRRAINRYINSQIPGRRRSRPDKLDFLIDRYMKYIMDTSRLVKNRTEEVLMAALNKWYIDHIDLDIVDEMYDRLIPFIRDLNREIEKRLSGPNIEFNVESYMKEYNRRLYDVIADRDPSSTEPRDGEILDDNLLRLLMALRWSNGVDPLDRTSLISYISTRDNYRSLRNSLLDSGFNLSDIILNYHGHNSDKNLMRVMDYIITNPLPVTSVPMLFYDPDVLDNIQYSNSSK